MGREKAALRRSGALYARPLRLRFRGRGHGLAGRAHAVSHRRQRREGEEAPAEAGLSEIEAAVRAFNSPCIDSELAHPFPDGVEILGWELANASLRLYVPAEYAALTGAERTVADCCAVLTFTAIEGVESVSIWSGDVMLSAPMRAGDFAAADASGY